MRTYSKVARQGRHGWLNGRGGGFIKCVWEVFVWGVVLVVCACVCVVVGSVVLCRCVCVWPVDIFNKKTYTRRRAAPSSDLAFTRYSFTLRFLCTNQSSLYCLPPLALPTIVQYYCTCIAQHTTPPRPPLAYAIHCTVLAMQSRVKANLRRYMRTYSTVGEASMAGSSDEERAWGLRHFACGRREFWWLLLRPGDWPRGLGAGGGGYICGYNIYIYIYIYMYIYIYADR